METQDEKYYEKKINENNRQILKLTVNMYHLKLLDKIVVEDTVASITNWRNRRNPKSKLIKE